MSSPHLSTAGKSLSFDDPNHTLSEQGKSGSSSIRNSVDKKDLEYDVHCRECLRKSLFHVNQVILGKEKQVELMFVALLAGGHVLLDDTPGMGKTTLARAMSVMLGLDLRRVQFTSDLMPSDIVGVSVPVAPTPGQAPVFKFQEGPVFTHLLLADEINRASPRTQSALLEAMAEHQVTVDGVSRSLPDPFWVVATQNPVDFSGTFALPDSQMDRFLFRMEIGYPDEDQEMNLLMGRQGGLKKHNDIKPFLNVRDVLSIQEKVKNIGVSELIAKYVLRLVAATRSHSGVVTGLSPRAGLSILSGAKALAWMHGRDFVSVEDIQSVFIPACAHRLVLNHHDFEERRNLAEQILQQTIAP